MSTTAATHLSVWTMDSAHSSLEFSIKHMMMTTVRGRFKMWQATITADEEHPEGCCVEATIDMASIDTGVPDRDVHLLGSDFFDVERYPTARFISRRLEGDFKKEGDKFRVVGDLTIRDTTLEVVLHCVFEGRGTDPWGKERAGFSCSTEFDRREWGLRWNQMIETGGVLVANKVKLDAETQFVRT